MERPDADPRDGVTLSGHLEDPRTVAARREKFSFRRMIAEVARTDVVIAFLAVLELLKSGECDARQGGPWGDIEVSGVPSRLRRIGDTAKNQPTTSRDRKRLCAAVLIVVKVDLCSGKTTLAHALAESNPVSAICRDEIREVLVHTIGLVSPDEDRQIAWRTYDLFFAVVQQARPRRRDPRRRGRLSAPPPAAGLERLAQERSSG